MTPIPIYEPKYAQSRALIIGIDAYRDLGVLNASCTSEREE